MSWKKFVCCSLVLAVFMSASHAASTSYLELRSASTIIEGDSTSSLHPNTIEIIAFSHEVTAPRDAASGLPTGSHSHTPVQITKKIDKTSPLIMDALINNELITQFRLYFVKTSPEGMVYDYYKIELFDARIVGIRQSQPNTLDPDYFGKPETESIWFVYDTMKWTALETNTAAEAKWDFVKGEVPRISDLNFDGAVNFLDLTILASQWLSEN